MYLADDKWIFRKANSDCHQRSVVTFRLSRTALELFVWCLPNFIILDARANSRKPTHDSFRHFCVSSALSTPLRAVISNSLVHHHLYADDTRFSCLFLLLTSYKTFLLRLLLQVCSWMSANLFMLYP